MSYANSYCLETDVERWTQILIDGTTHPTSTESGDFAEERASLLSALCTAWGFTVTPATISVGSRLEDLLRRANAIGTALDCTLVQQFRQSPSKSDRADMLESLWVEMVGDSDFIGTIQIEVTTNLSAGLASSHIISGDMVAATTGTAPTDAGIVFTMGDVF